MKSLFINIITLLIIQQAFSQNKNFIDQPYLETSAKVDTLVVPDKIYLTIYLSEQDSKGKTSIEIQENKMANALKNLNINIDEQLSLSDLSSNFKKYFLKQKDIHKAKSYSLIVYDALTAGKVILALEKEKISNVGIEKLSYSKIEDLKLNLKSKAILKAKQNAIALTQPLGQNIGNAIHITDQFQNFRYRNEKESSIKIKGSSFQDSQPLDIEFEKIRVESTVSVKFALE
ncbi:SIMPL domain-containing protein [Urechidicola vernalis]|uniref:SIMPL domain-containing protein n=1 Tax=Urechidicola vernalis TaxID=3075600 RepID=A0ABU2Y3C0_9FLAO|nr:SIMPL domain-containing protein [Urechidicola sp. P050]MDT0552711.1 SIMPL domain-containing protein [Urechidicola sp. P050]